MSSSRPVLVSWIARNNDPFERNRDDSFREEHGARIPGPTWTVLLDPDSPYRGQIQDVWLLHRAPVPPAADAHKRAEELKLVEESKSLLEDEAHHQGLPLNIHLIPWEGSDPTEHKPLFDFMEGVLKRVRKEHPQAPLVLHLSPGTPSMHAIWLLLAETGWVDGPFRLIKSHRARERNGRPAVEEIRLELPSLFKRLVDARPQRIGSPEEDVFWDPKKFRSPKLKALYQKASAWARLPVPILILGERGTGKTHLASWIRLNSPFRKRDQDGKWPSVPCGQYTPELMRMELFGHVKGAFTGAKGEKKGLLHQANQDTLFLDELGDISSELQRLLIRAIEDKHYLPVGGLTLEKSEFRLITATNRPLEKLKSQLDDDFFDRISTCILTLPSLRDIPEDLPWLWERVFQRVLQDAGNTISGERARRIVPAQHDHMVERLRTSQLPGNLRDLFRVAWHLMAALEAHETSRISLDDAITQALNDGLDEASSRAEQSGPGSDIPLQASQAIRVAHAFAHQKPLEAALDSAESLDWDGLEASVNAWLASEVRRLAEARNVDPKELCGRDKRTLQKYIKAEKDRQHPSSGTGKTD